MISQRIQRESQYLLFYRIPTIMSDVKKKKRKETNRRRKRLQQKT
jgi:hypothetical protein